MDPLEGLINNLPRILRKFQPRKLKPSVIWVIRVLSSDSSRPLSLRKIFSRFFISLAVSSESAVTTKSSQYLTKFTLQYFLPFLGYLVKSSFSIPSRVTFARIGEINPP